MKQKTNNVLFKNATFYTMDNNKITSKVLVNDGIVVAIGNDCKKYHIEKEVDLLNSYVYPGLTDSHIHLIGYGRKLFSNNLNLINDKQKALKLIKAFYNEETLKIEGYKNLNINKDDLDKISENDYIILRHYDYHSFTVNTKVLNALNIKSNTGIILNEDDSKKVNELWETNTKEELIKFTKAGIENLIKYGITSVHTEDLSYFNSYDETTKILKDLSNKYNFRIYSLIHIDVLNEYIKHFPKDKYFKDIQIKMFYDGTLSSKTAYISGLYDNGLNGKFDNKKFIKDFLRVRKLNLAVAVHVIGDKSLRDLNELFKNYYNKYDRLIHASLIDNNTLDNLVTKHIDIQPLFIKSDKEIVSTFKEYNNLIHPINKYINNDILLNISSDAPVSSVNVFLNIIALLKENVNINEIIKMYTVNPNKTINENKGIIKVGYKADFSCYNFDLYKINEFNYKNYQTSFTIVDGKIIYKL